MKTKNWLLVLFNVLLCTGNILLTNGQSEVDTPNWSDQVETQLRFFVTELKQVLEAKIYFDKTRSALAISVADASDTSRKQDILLIYRFNEKQRMSIVDNKCNPTGNIERENNSIPFTEGENLKDFGSLFYFDPINYAKLIPLNQNKIDGTEAEMWKSENVVINAYSFTVCNITHYINKIEKGKNHFNKFLKIEGTCFVERESAEEEPIEAHITIDFFESKDFISNAEIFQQPSGVYCPFLNSTKEYPLLPPYFSFNFLTLDSDNELGYRVLTTSFRKKIWFHSSQKLLRRDNLDWNFDISSTIISDYNARLSYLIFPSGDCNINELKATDTMESGVTLPGENFPLFPGSTSNTPQYVGQRIRNGVTFDVWVNKNDDAETIEISDYYFANNILTEENLTLTFPAFIETFIFKSDGMLVGNALQIIGEYRTKPSIQDQSTFDVTKCFPDNNKTQFTLTFSKKGNNSLGDIDQQELVNGIREKLFAILKIGRLRLGAIQISYLNETSVHLSSILVEDPSRLGYKQGKEEISSVEALKTLSRLVNETEFFISMGTKDEPQKKVVLTATMLTFPCSQECSNIFDDKNNKDNKKHKPGGFTSGTLAAVGIAMLAVGIFQGIVLLVAYIRYRKSDPLLRRLTGSEEQPAQKPE